MAWVRSSPFPAAQRCAFIAEAIDRHLRREAQIGDDDDAGAFIEHAAQVEHRGASTLTSVPVWLASWKWQSMIQHLPLAHGIARVSKHAVGACPL